MNESSDVRKRWQDEERVLRARMGPVGLATPEQFKSLPDLELLGLILNSPRIVRKAIR
jgi:hypothetical protein